MNERLSFQIGRQRFDDEREWLYDEELDAALMFSQFSRFSLELSVSRESLVDKDLLNDDLEPSITLGYAFGTGDGDPDDSVDKSFRQTGLQANEAGFNGVPDFKYYGELFDPELSNLSIFTAGAGIKPTEDSSIDLVYHYYLQDTASDSLRDVGIDADPDGRSKRLGSEIDLIAGYEGIKNNLAVALMLGYFIPGKAFRSDSENSFLTKLVIEFEF